MNHGKCFIFGSSFNSKFGNAASFITWIIEVSCHIDVPLSVFAFRRISAFLCLMFPPFLCLMFPPVPTPKSFNRFSFIGNGSEVRLRSRAIAVGIHAALTASARRQVGSKLAPEAVVSRDCQWSSQHPSHLCPTIPSFAIGIAMQRARCMRHFAPSERPERAVEKVTTGRHQTGGRKKAGTAHTRKAASIDSTAFPAAGRVTDSDFTGGRALVPVPPARPAQPVRLELDSPAPLQGNCAGCISRQRKTGRAGMANR